ncbi:MAG: DUF1566 domain-containing protein [Deltaproteobacteria bacterium]|nr:DUF1566 domain-containing protein [Deltaproteobacteria bacterium]
MALDRENFYDLLELSVDPLEEDPRVIEEAIKKKQAQWSRFRNHPTKGIQAKKFIGFLPEIRRIMMDPELRKEEARHAAIQQSAKAEEKFVSVDRHLSIQMSKGYITDEEVAKLAELHGLAEKDIRDRIAHKEAEKFAEIDKQIGVRLAKGYVTEEEVAKLAKMHGLEVDVIRRRITGPVVKEGESAGPAGKSLESTIARGIEDNLAVLGLASLYEFLEVEHNASLKLLQKKAQFKQTEISKISKKDAIVTASTILVGHCIAIFKTEESRSSYDISRARSQLKDLDNDIEIAGMDGTLRSEYMKTLISSAARFGMDEEEALAYIHQYVKEKGWTIEGEEKKAKRAALARDLKKYAILGGIGLVLVLAAVIALLMFLKANRLEKEYNTAIEAAHAEKSPEKQLAVLKQYVNAAGENKHTQKAGEEIAALSVRIEKAAFDEAKKSADAFSGKKEFEKAAQTMEAFLAKYKGGQMIGSAQAELARLRAATDDRDFNTLISMVNRNVDDRMVAYVGYIKKYPKGAHLEEVKKLISDTAEEFYLSVKKNIDAFAEAEKWGEAITLCETYVGLFDNPRAVELGKLADSYRTYQKEALHYQRLLADAQAKGGDLDAAEAVYREFLEAYPGTSVQKKIEDRLKEIAAKKEGRKDAATQAQVRSQLNGSRFVPGRNGTVTDRRTGLTWTILDSAMEGRPCMDYPTAKQYAEELTTGGFSNWRLPTPAELKGIYKAQPAFPSWNTDMFYWSSKSYRAFTDQWVNVVEVVSPVAGGSSEETRESNRCGLVHAVRR